MRNTPTYQCLLSAKAALADGEYGMVSHELVKARDEANSLNLEIDIDAMLSVWNRRIAEALDPESDTRGDFWAYAIRQTEDELARLSEQAKRYSQ